MSECRSVVLAHPNPQSFNHAIAQAAVDQLRQNGHRPILHDLYAEGFDPLLPTEEIPADGLLPAPVQTHCDEIASADGIILVHPNWWGQPPAILKGWVDRVFRPDVAYRFLEGDKGEGVPIGLLRAKAALVFNTSNTFHEREARVFGDPLENLWKTCVFEFCGVDVFHREMFTPIVVSTLEQRCEWLERVRRTVDAYFPHGGD